MLASSENRDLRTRVRSDVGWAGRSAGTPGTIARYAYDPTGSKAAPALTKRLDMQVGTSGLLGGIAEDPATRRIA
ncbi:MAG: hypothetical protein ABI186_07730 [Candidatus Elarobacter sp.]